MKKKMETRPREGSAGAHSERREPRGLEADDEEEEEDQVGEGAEVAPTAEAAEDQRARHAEEGSSERIAARIPGKQGSTRPDGTPK
jgi:hypothetical protein